MSYAKILAQLRKECGFTQTAVAAFISQHSKRTYTFKMISHWENGKASPSVEHFLLLCEYYGVEDIQGVFRGIGAEYRSLSGLNSLGRNRAKEYIAMLKRNPLFSEYESSDSKQQCRNIRLFDIPVAAGTGSFLDGDSYEDFEVDETVPKEADFAVKVSGDSMTPRFVDGQIAFIHEQPALDPGEIGIFELNGDSYIKKLGQGELLSLNPLYKPIRLQEYDSFRIFGKVVG